MRSHRVAMLVWVGVVVAALSGAVAPQVDAAAQTIDVTVTASPDVLKQPNTFAVWRITLKHRSGPIVGDTVSILFDHSDVRFSSCTATCIPDSNGIDVSWTVAPLTSQVTLKVTMLFTGGPGPIIGRVYLKDGLCHPGCPVSASVNVANPPTPTPSPTPSPTPRPTPTPTSSPTPAPTVPPAPLPAPRSTPRSTTPPAGRPSPSPVVNIQVLAATSPPSADTASASPSSAPLGPIALASVAPTQPPAQVGQAPPHNPGSGSGSPIGDLPAAALLAIIVTAALIPVAGAMYRLSRRP